MRVDPSEQRTPYEVYCQRCRVSFPVGTRQCMHCGSRIGRARSRPVARTQPGAAPLPPVPGEMGEEEVGARSGMMSPIAILWIVLLVGGAIYRACS